MTYSPLDGAEPLDERYVAFLDPSMTSPNTREASAYSVEGYLAGVDAFASGASRSHGWRRVAAKLMALAILLPLLAASAKGLLELVDLLLG